MPKKTIFVSNFHPFISRNIFDSGAIDRITAGAKHVYVFVPLYKEAFLRNKYEKGNLTIIGIDLEAEINTVRETRHRRLAEILLNTDTKKLHQRIYWSRGGSFIKYIAARLVMSVSGTCSWIRTLYRTYILKNLPATPFDMYYAQYLPDLTVVTDPFSPYDTVFMKAARKAKTRLVAIVRSWDNFTTKEYLQVLPDTVLVQNEDMIEEGYRYHDIPKLRMKLIGVPQFEYYRRYSPVSREDFCARMKLDPKKEIVLFSPAGDKFSSTDWQVCELLKTALEQGSFVKPVQFLVRLHPMNPTDLSSFTPTNDFVIDDPRIEMAGNAHKQIEMGMKEVGHLADSLVHPTVVINVVSSLIIDAAILDKPVVTVSFDGWEKDVPLTHSVLAEQSNEWLRVILDKGLSPCAKTSDELTELINAYLIDPSRDHEKRVHFVEAHCWKLDGKAPERIAQYVLEDGGAV